MTASETPCTIRPALPNDYDEIVAVWTASGLPTSPTGRESRRAFLSQLEWFPTSYLVATEAGRVVGVVLGSHDHRKGWINRLAVQPEFRRRGIAIALAKACERAIHDEGIEIIAALVDPTNISSLAVFETLGYHTDVPVRYFRKLRRPDV